MRLFEELLADDEGHINFLEMQLELPQSIGFENYAPLNALPAAGNDN